MKPSEILEKAAAHMERVGLCKGDFWERDVINSEIDAPCCALGAIYSVDPEADESVRALLRRSLGWEPGATPVNVIADWNDAPERTRAEVVAKLREAAELARSEGR